MISAAGDFDFLALPGRGNSGPDHWMSHWCRAFPNSSRVLQAEWDRPAPEDWIGRVDGRRKDQDPRHWLQRPATRPQPC
ncbi:alpha/beta hydrolase [Mesorhizobium escarrei]|uniref:Uncharacterized protein n=1 Tax=Mesorhizobium escarrei TaxID=666018 RepID=A0ABN8JRT4_9HYPH|nr:hypothetical protein MES5069_230158 [Mesorhizobium escarrei]